MTTPPKNTLPTGPLSADMTLMLTKKDIEAILRWYVEDIHSTKLDSLTITSDSYNNVTVTCKVKVLIEPNPSRIKASPSESQIGIEID